MLAGSAGQHRNPLRHHGNDGVVPVGRGLSLYPRIVSVVLRVPTAAGSWVVSLGVPWVIVEVLSIVAECGWLGAERYPA